MDVHLDELVSASRVSSARAIVRRSRTGLGEVVNDTPAQVKHRLEPFHAVRISRARGGIIDKRLYIGEGFLNPRRFVEEPDGKGGIRRRARHNETSVCGRLELRPRCGSSQTNCGTAPSNASSPSGPQGYEIQARRKPPCRCQAPDPPSLTTRKLQRLWKTTRSTGRRTLGLPR
jgi:hypothetical protein